MSGPIQDYAVAGAVISTPFWLHLVESGYSIVIAIGVGLLLAMRLWLTWKDVQNKRKEM